MDPLDDTLVRIGDEVRDAVQSGRAVVALETTLLVHGLPPDDAVRVGDEIEAVVRKHGAIPATVGVVDGTAVVGLSSREVELLIARRDDVRKLSTRDLGSAHAARIHGATTVAATIALAHRAGLEVMATGGIGGVHRDARESYDESADLVALARSPVLVVASGVKSILDVPSTLERLDTLGVPVVTFRSTRFPGFYVVDSGLAAEWTAISADEAARAFAAHRQFAATGMLLANPVPSLDAMDPAAHALLLEDGLQLVQEQGIRGKEVTPFLLAHFAHQSKGRSVAVNTALVLDNAAVAADVAVALASR